MKCEPQQEHQWLHKLVGEWTYESECDMGPDQPPGKWSGTEKVSSIGGLWVVCEGEGEMPDGGKGLTRMTLGFDPARGRYVGSWVGSMMANMWVYDGEVDAGGRILTLDCEGPSFTEEGGRAQYQDIIEWISDDHRVLSSRVLRDGQWVHMMSAHYRRVR